MIYLITGLMASGKSTVAALLAARFPRAVHLRGDVFRRMIASGREEMSAQPGEEALRQLDLRYRLAAEAAKGYRDAGFAVVLQDNYYGEMLPRILELLEPAPVQVIVLCPDAETIQKREKARGKNGYTGFAVEDLYASFLVNTPRIGVWIDNSRQAPEDTVQQIWDEIVQPTANAARTASATNPSAGKQPENEKAKEMHP